MAIQDERMDRLAAAKYLGVSVALLAADVITQRHKIPFIKIGRRCVYSRSQLDAWMRERMINAPSASIA